MLQSSSSILWFKKLLVAIDFSPPSHEALRTATVIAADGGAELVLAHVWQPLVTANGATGSAEFPVTYEQDALRVAESELASWKTEAEQVGAKRVSILILTGTPWHALVELLRRDASFDLAVTGTHGRTGLRHVLLGSVAERIVRHAPCPVLVVRVRE